MTTDHATPAAERAAGAAIQAAPRVARRVARRVASDTMRARSWTGRAALSAVTSTAVPRLVTSGTHRTRVSEMRGAGAAAPPAFPPARRALARRSSAHPAGG